MTRQVFKLLEQHPDGFRFYNSLDNRKSLGFNKPHQLDLFLGRLSQMGFVVIRGEGTSGMFERVSHRFGVHNWMPEQVVIVPRSVFKAQQEKYRAWNPGAKVGWLSVSAFQDKPLYGQTPEGGGRKQRIRGQFAAWTKAVTP